MKKLLSVLLAVLMIAALLALPALAEEAPGDVPVSGFGGFLSNAVAAAVQAQEAAQAAQEAEPSPESERDDEPFADDIDDVQPFYVLDFADILTDDQEAALTESSAAVSQTYGCSIHIGVVADMGDYGYTDIEPFAEEFFSSCGLGLGEERTGILLLLSMAERDYDIDAHGSFAHYAFTDYGKTTLSDVFLDNFRQNDWYGGFADYIDRCGEMLELAQNDEPVDVWNVPASPAQQGAGVGLSAVISLLIAWVVCSLLKGRNKSVRAASDADRYVPAGAVHFRIRDDRFLHQTVTRVKIERERSSGGGGGGGTTISSGGHSHSSGKF